MPYYLYFIIPVAIIAVVAALVMALRSRVDLARQISDTVASIFGEFTAWLRGITLFDLRKAMRNGLRGLKQSSQSSSYRYERPWYLMVGAESSGKTTLLRSMIGSDEGEDNHAANWGIFPKGAVIDIAGTYFQPNEQPGTRMSLRNRGWRKVLRRLQAYRERRPLDGVILTVNINQLPTSNVLDDTTAQSLRQVRYKLHQMTKRLGMRIPVYVVCTHCDTIPNFLAFYHALTPQHQREILGWSSPYALDVAYEASWVDSAMTHILERLASVQYDAMNNAGNNTAQRDNVYDVYSSIRQLAQPLQRWADAIFGANGHDSELMLRGIYLTGHELREEQSEIQEQQSQAYQSPFDVYPAQAPEQGAVRTIQQGMFCSEILDRKIFRETGVAMPLRQHHVRRSYLSIATHLLFALLLITGVTGVVMTWKDMNKRRDEIQTILNKMYDERESSFGAKAGKAYDYAEKTRQYLGYFSTVEKNKLFSFAVPASWFGGLHRNVRNAIADGLKEVIIPGARKEFDNRAELLTEPSRDYLDADTLLMNRYAITTTPEYRALQSFVLETGNYEFHADLFNKLAEPHSDQRLSKIISYLFGKNIEPDVQQMIESDYQLMKSVDVQKISFENYRKNFTAKANDLNDKLIAKLFTGNPVVLSVKYFKESYHNVRNSSNSETMYHTFLDMAKQLEVLSDALGTKETAWLSGDDFVFDDTGNRLIRDMEKSRLLGSGISGTVAKKFDSSFVLMRALLAHAMIDMRDGLEDSTAVLKLHPESHRFVMTANIEATYKALAEWKKQPFIVKDDGSDNTPVNDSENDDPHIIWNNEVLKTLPTALESYTKYLSEGINKFPPELQIPAEVVVRKGIHKTVNDIVDRAAYKPYTGTARTQQDVSIEVQAFQDATQNLSLALRQLSTSDDNSGTYLAHRLGRQTVGVLRSIDQWLHDMKPQPYTPVINAVTIGEWKPNQSILSAAFDIAEADELQEYLEKQRKPLESWSKQFAQPMIGFYSQNGLGSAARSSAEEEEIRRWQNIIRALDGYVAKSPNNSVRQLEDFMSKLSGIYMKDTEEMQKIAMMTRKNATASARDDYFLKKINDIASEIKRGIAGSSDLRFDKNYENIRKATSTVEQLFPFGTSTQDAEPEKVREYYERIANDLDFAKLYIAMGGNIPREQEQYLKKIYASKEFFKPLILSADNNSGAYTVTMTFRTNQRDELNAKGVYARVVSQTQSGSEFNKTLITPGEQAQFQWRPGDEFRFELIWAKDGGVSPLSNSGIYEVSGDNRAIFRKSGTWSLFRFLSEVRNSAYPNKMQLELRVVTDAKESPATVIYVDVEITPRAKESSFTLPILGQ